MNKTIKRVSTLSVFCLIAIFSITSCLEDIDPEYTEFGTIESVSSNSNTFNFLSDNGYVLRIKNSVDVEDQERVIATYTVKEDGNYDADGYNYIVEVSNLSDVYEQNMTVLDTAISDTLNPILTSIAFAQTSSNSLVNFELNYMYKYRNITPLLYYYPNDSINSSNDIPTLILGAYGHGSEPSEDSTNFVIQDYVTFNIAQLKNFSTPNEDGYIEYQIMTNKGTSNEFVYEGLYFKP